MLPSFVVVDITSQIRLCDVLVIDVKLTTDWLVSLSAVTRFLATV